MLEKIEMDFTPDGQLIPPSIIMPPEVWKANEAKFKEWEQDKEFTVRLIGRLVFCWFLKKKRSENTSFFCSWH